MNRGIYATGTGMLATLRLMDTIANNLANASTTGYKRDEITFGDALQREMRADAGRGRFLGTLGTGATEFGTNTVFEPGPIAKTGNPLDVAIMSKEGLFAVQTEQGVRYTRDGAFKLSDEGLLVDQNGNSVLDERQQPIQQPDGKLEIFQDGAVKVDGKEVGKIGVFTGDFVKVGDSLFAGADTQAVDDVQLATSSLEGSNVNTVEAMIEMISANRAFEMAQRSIQQQDELAQKLIQSLQS